MRLLFIAFLVVLSMSLAAQSPENIRRAPDNYVRALQSDCPGMVESGIFHSVKFAIYFPEQDTESILRELRRLAQNGASGCIRYKAYLAAEYLQNKKLLTAIKKKNYKDSEQFFRLLNENYQRQIFLAESE